MVTFAVVEIASRLQLPIDANDAGASINGFHYQILCTIFHLLTQPDDQQLAIEFGEDVAMLGCGIVASSGVSVSKLSLFFDQQKAYKNALRFNASYFIDTFLKAFHTIDIASQGMANSFFKGTLKFGLTVSSVDQTSVDTPLFDAWHTFATAKQPEMTLDQFLKIREKLGNMQKLKAVLEHKCNKQNLASTIADDMGLLYLLRGFIPCRVQQDKLRDNLMTLLEEYTNPSFDVEAVLAVAYMNVMQRAAKRSGDDRSDRFMSVGTWRQWLKDRSTGPLKASETRFKQRLTTVTDRSLNDEDYLDLVSQLKPTVLVSDKIVGAWVEEYNLATKEKPLHTFTVKTKAKILNVIFRGKKL